MTTKVSMVNKPKDLFSGRLLWKVQITAVLTDSEEHVALKSVIRQVKVIKPPVKSKEKKFIVDKSTLKTRIREYIDTSHSWMDSRTFIEYDVFWRVFTRDISELNEYIFNRLFVKRRQAKKFLEETLRKGLSIEQCDVVRKSLLSYR